MELLYIGATRTSFVSSDPATLVVGKRYEVDDVTTSWGRLLYTLRGVAGRYDSRWFERPDTVPYFVAVAPIMPTVGSKMRCQVLTGGRENEFCTTSLILYIRHLSRDIYCVHTMNSVYFVRCEGANLYNPEDTCVFLDTTVKDLLGYDSSYYEEQFDKRTCYDDSGRFRYRSVLLVRIDELPEVGKRMLFTFLDPEEDNGFYYSPVAVTAVEYVGNQLYLVRAGHNAFIAYMGD